MRYRRAWMPGVTFFFTVNLAERRSRVLVDQVDCLRTAFRTVRSNHPFRINAIVVLPNHLHAIWTLPEDDSDFAMRWGLIKASFSRALSMEEMRNQSRAQKGERGIWQRRFWEHRIRDQDDFSRHVDYIHWNPVKHCHVSRATDWPYSSIHRFIRDGMLSADWGVAEAFGDAGFGEAK